MKIDCIFRFVVLVVVYSTARGNSYFITLVFRKRSISSQQDLEEDNDKQFDFQQF